MTAPLVELCEVSKHFGGVHAVERVSLTIEAGAVLALVGHNGAGKSTLLQLLAGVFPPDAGEIRVGGVPVRLRSPRDAQRLGFATLYQDLALADNLDATANIFLGHERRTRWGTLDEDAMEHAAQAVMERLAPGFDALHEPVERLSGGQRQLVAIARALQLEARVLLMDEPTAALGPAEARRIADLVQRLTGEGLAIVLVSHDLRSALALADRVAVMRGGRIVTCADARSLDADALLQLVVGGSAAPAPGGIS